MFSQHHNKSAPFPTDREELDRIWDQMTYSPEDVFISIGAHFQVRMGKSNCLKNLKFDIFRREPLSTR